MAILDKILNRKSEQPAESGKPTRLLATMPEEYHKIAENWTDIRQIMVNVNYFLGNQWIGWNRAERRIQVLPVESHQERVTVNKIRPRVMTLLAKHTKNKVKFDVTPASREQHDIDTARAADKFVHGLWGELDMDGKTRDIFLNILVKKRCWLKVWFDPDAGGDITPGKDDPGYEEWSKGPKRPIRQGLIRARVCDALEIFADPAAKSEDEIRWIVERVAVDVDEIYERYGVRVSPDANLDYLNTYDLARMATDGIGVYESQRKQNMALVYELWMRPCEKYPHGAKITVAGGKELDYNDKAGDLPYTLFGYIPIPGTTLYDALVTDMIAPQRSINIKRSMIATHAKRLGNAMWLNPIGSNADEEMLTNEIAGIIDYTPVGGAKPERVEAPNIPNFFDRDLANDAVDLDDTSGAREVSQGRMPAGLDTMGGLQIMVEQENEKLVVASQNYERGMKRAMKRVLRLVRDHYTEERQVRLIGEDNEIELISFRGADLTGYEDIHVVEGSSLPEIKAAQQERIMLMWQSGAIVKKDGTPDHFKLLKLMGMGDSTELFEQHMLDENNAKLENKQFEDMAQNPEALQAAEEYMQALQQYQAATQNMPPEQAQQIPQPPPPPGMPPLWDSDDDDVHILVHNTFRKTSRYRNLPPPIRILVDMHYMEHVQRMQAPMMAQQAEEAAREQERAERETQQKEADRAAAMQRDALKANTALQTAALKRS